MLIVVPGTAGTVRSTRSMSIRCSSRLTRSVIVCSTPRLVIRVTAWSWPKPERQRH